MSSKFVSIDERAIDHFISALSVMKANGGVVGNLGVLLVQSSAELCGDDDHETDIVTLRYLKSSRDALRVILQVANDEIHNLQKKCMPVTVHRGFQSLPDDILRNMFEIGYETYNNENWDHTFPVALSHVNQRFRSIALSTPRIWTNLNNGMPAGQLETFISRSKAADLSIILDLVEPVEREPGSPETLIEITKRHSDRWSSFTYKCSVVDEEPEDVVQYGYTHPALSQCHHLTLPRLRSLSCHKYYFDAEYDITSSPEAIFATWALPEFVRFDGLNALVKGNSIGKNVTCCKLQFDGEVSWDFRKLLRRLESWSHLESLSFYVSDFKHSPRVGQSSLRNVNSFDMEVGKSVDVGFIEKFFSLVKMQALSSMSIKFGDEHGTDVQRMIYTICAAARHYPTLQSFTLDTSRVHGAHYNTLHTVASNFPSLQDVLFRGTRIYGYQRYDYSPPPSWQKFSVEGATLRDWHDIEFFMGVMKSSLHWDNFKLQIPACIGLCGVMPEAKRRFGDKMEFAGQTI